MGKKIQRLVPHFLTSGIFPYFKSGEENSTSFSALFKKWGRKLLIIFPTFKSGEENSMSCSALF